MPSRLKGAARTTVGAKQTHKALKAGKVLVCYIARDAEVRITEPLRSYCESNGVELVYVDSMEQLGKFCGIDVGAAAAAILK